MKCLKHPRYTGKLRPRVPCYMCWVKYATDNPREKFTAKEMLGMGEAAVEFEGNRIMASKDWRQALPVGKNGLLVLGRNTQVGVNGPMTVHPVKRKRRPCVVHIGVPIGDEGP